MTHGRPSAGSPAALLREALHGPTTGPLAPVRPMVLALLREAVHDAPTHAELCRRLGISLDAWARLRELPEIGDLSGEIGAAPENEDHEQRR